MNTVNNINKKESILIPGGFYNAITIGAQCAESELSKKQNSNDGYYLAIKFSILDPQYFDAHITNYFNFVNTNPQAVTYSHESWARFLNAIAVPPFIVDPRYNLQKNDKIKIFYKYAKIKVGTYLSKPNNTPKNKIEEYWPADNIPSSHIFVASQPTSNAVAAAEKLFSSSPSPITPSAPSSHEDFDLSRWVPDDIPY